MAKWLSKIKPRTKIFGIIASVVAIAGIGTGLYFLQKSPISASGFSITISGKVVTKDGIAAPGVDIFFGSGTGMAGDKRATSENNGTFSFMLPTVQYMSGSQAFVFAQYHSGMSNVVRKTLANDNVDFGTLTLNKNASDLGIISTAANPAADAGGGSGAVANPAANAGGGSGAVANPAANAGGGAAAASSTALTDASFGQISYEAKVCIASSTWKANYIKKAWQDTRGSNSSEYGYGAFKKASNFSGSGAPAEIFQGTDNATYNRTGMDGKGWTFSLGECTATSAANPAANAGGGAAAASSTALTDASFGQISYEAKVCIASSTWKANYIKKAWQDTRGSNSSEYGYGAFKKASNFSGSGAPAEIFQGTDNATYNRTGMDGKGWTFSLGECTATSAANPAANAGGGAGGGAITQNTVRVKLFATIDGKKTPVVNGSVFYKYNKAGTWTNMPETRTTEALNYADIVIQEHTDAVRASKYFVVGSKSFSGGRTVYTEQKEVAVPPPAGTEIELSFENRITSSAEANDTSGSYTAANNPANGAGFSAPVQTGKPVLPSGNCSLDTSVWIPSFAAGDKHFTPAGNAKITLTFTYSKSEWNNVGITSAADLLQPEVAYAKSGSEVCTAAGSMDGYIGALDGKSIIICYKNSDTNAVFWLTNVADKAVKTGTFQGNEEEIDGTISTPYGQLKMFGRTKDLLWLESAVSKTTTGVGAGAVPTGGGGTAAGGGSGGSGGTGVPQISIGAPYDTGTVKPVFGNSKIEYNSKVKSIKGQSKDISIVTPDNGSTVSINNISCNGVVKASVKGPQGFFNTEYWAPISTTTNMKRLSTVVNGGSDVPPIIDTGDGNISVLHQLNSYGRVYLAKGVSYCPKGYAIFVAGPEKSWIGWQCAEVDNIDNPTKLFNYTSGKNNPFMSEADYGMPRLKPGQVPSVLGTDGKSSGGNMKDRIRMCLRDSMSLDSGKMSIIESILFMLLAEGSNSTNAATALLSKASIVVLALQNDINLTIISEKIPCLMGSSASVSPGMSDLYLPADQRVLGMYDMMNQGYLFP